MTAPHARSGAGLRVLRAAVFAAVCVVLAAAGHSIASCATVPLWTLGAGFLGAVLVVAPLAGRERALPGIATLLTVGQTVLHVLFGLGQHGSPVSTASTASDAALVARAARLLCGTTAAAISPAQAQKVLTDARLYSGTAPHSTDAMTSMSSLSPLSMSMGDTVSPLPSLPMVLGHVVAAVAAGWLLRRGDLALLRLVELSQYSARTVAEGAFVRSLRAAFALVRTLRAGLPGAPAAGPRPLCARAPAPTALRTTALQHTVIRRGPPADALLLAA